MFIIAIRGYEGVNQDASLTIKAKLMKKESERFDVLEMPAGLKRAKAVLASTHVELFGPVTLVEGYDLPGFVGCHALVSLRDTPGKTVAVLATAERLQSLLETALTTGNLIAFLGRKYTSPPTPRGGTWSVDVYGIDGVILYNMN